MHKRAEAAADERKYKEFEKTTDQYINNAKTQEQKAYAEAVVNYAETTGYTPREDLKPKDKVPPRGEWIWTTTEAEKSRNELKAKEGDVGVDGWNDYANESVDYADYLENNLTEEERQRYAERYNKENNDSQDTD